MIHCYRSQSVLSGVSMSSDQLDKLLETFLLTKDPSPVRQWLDEQEEKTFYGPEITPDQPTYIPDSKDTFPPCEKTPLLEKMEAPPDNSTGQEKHKAPVEEGGPNFSYFELPSPTFCSRSDCRMSKSSCLSVAFRSNQE